MHRVARTICYLDYDGCVHADEVYRDPGRGLVMRAPGRAMFEWCSVLVDALEPYPDVRIVLSTSWVRELGYDRARGYLPHALSERVIGATFHRREHAPTRDLRWLWAQSRRGDQIAADVQRRVPVRWFAIDDAVDEFSERQAEWLVPCESSTGLSAPDAQQALQEMLQRVHE